MAVTVTYVGPAPDPGYAYVSVVGTGANDGTMHISIAPGETPTQAATRWANAAFAVPLAPAQPSVNSLLETALNTVAADPALAPATKQALADMVTALKSSK